MKKGIDVKKIFKEKLGKCLKEIEKQNLKIHNLPSVWSLEQEDFDEFIKEADEALTTVVSICSKIGVEISIDFNKTFSKDWSKAILKTNKNVIYDYDKDSEIMIKDFFVFMDSVYKMINVPIVLLLFGCVRRSEDIYLKTIHSTVDDKGI